MLYVIRHGQVNTNIKNQVNGWNEEKLNSVGIQQAINAGNQLKNIRIDVVFCSPLLRTKQTYTNLNLKDIPIFYDDRIKERNSNSMVYADVETF
jgi:phosphoglycerate mutase (glycolysis)